MKCVVWDLDNTVWDGILLEDGEVEVRAGVAEVIRELDARGILQSVASRNDADAARDRLARAGLLEYFLLPQIGWGAKSDSVRRVAEALNINLDTFLFIDDDAFERAEVLRAHPQVRVSDPADPRDLLRRNDLTPSSVTADGARRRSMYQAELRRAGAEQEFTGTPEEFLASLDIRMAVRPAEPADLGRAEELTVRTNQLNATGYTYSAAELAALRTSPAHSLLVTEVSDRFGDYGTVGLVLLERSPGTWILKLLLVSCRVMSRGVGTVLLNTVIAQAKQAGVRLVGEFVPTDRNRQMLVAYRFAGFTPAGERAGVTLLEHSRESVPAVPPYLDLRVDGFQFAPETGSTAVRRPDTVAHCAER